MTNEEILNKYIKLIVEDYCEDCNELNCIDNYPHKRIAIAISELLLQNKSLKSKNNQLKEENKQLEILVECLKLGVTLNRKQEKLLDKVLFSKEVK